jgi:hypothetical protein
MRQLGWGLLEIPSSVLHVFGTPLGAFGNRKGPMLAISNQLLHGICDLRRGQRFGINYLCNLIVLFYLVFDSHSLLSPSLQTGNV